MYSRAFTTAIMTLALALAGALPLVARADDPHEADDFKKRKLEQVKATKAKDLGWDGKLSLGASVALAHSSNVVGQIDGTTFTLGFQIDSGLYYIKGVHEWRNSLKLLGTFSRTPVVDEFVKTTDVFSFESIYLYRIKRVPWFGPFGRLQVVTQIFPSRDVRGEDVSYKIKLLDGTDRLRVAPDIHLSDAFTPITIKETIGAFAKPVEKEQATVEIKLGFGARETLANGQYAVKDDKDTPEIEVIELKSFAQAGPSLGAKIEGKLLSKKLLYNAEAEVMLPVVYSLTEGDDRNAFDLLNVSIEAGLTFKVFSWASLQYILRAIREPQLVDKFQVQNNLLLTFSYDLFKSELEKKKQAKK